MDIYPLVAAAAGRYDLPATLLLAMLIAESGLNRTAARYGEWPDVSFGYCQMIVATAAGYGIGDGTNTAANIAAVRDALFDRERAIDVGARHLAGCWAEATPYADRELQALIAYNSGSCQPEGNWYWQRYGGNVNAYRAALARARAMLAP